MDIASRYVSERGRNPRMPATKDNLKYKYNRLGKELDTIRSEYEDNVQSVIHDLERRYNETRNWPLPCYGKLKRMIKDSTNDVVISKCRVPVHEHSIKNMGDRKDVYEQYTTMVYQNPKLAAAAEKYGHSGILGYCKLQKAIVDKQRRSPRKDVEKMHKEEIETENDDLKHHIRCYDCKFLRAQDTLRELKEDYSESKRYLPHLRYRRMKKMIERVIEKKELLQLD